jgi:phosphatidylethanolamine-binding protein
LSKADVGGEEFTDRRAFKAVEFIEKHGLKLVSINWFLGVGDTWKE